MAMRMLKPRTRTSQSSRTRPSIRDDGEAEAVPEV